MANDFSARSDCLALYRFEDDPGLLEDSKNNVDLTNSASAVANDSTAKEGSKAAKFEANKYLSIADSALPNTWPCKSGQSQMLYTICCWVYPTTVDTNFRVIWSKFDTAKAFDGITLKYSNTGIFLYHHLTAYTMGAALTANQWHHITLTVDLTNMVATCAVFNDTTGVNSYVTKTLTQAVGNNDAPFYIGADVQLTANKGFLGNIDEFAVFSSVLNNFEAAAIRDASFPVAANHSYWHIDPIDGLDSGAGVSWATARKTLRTTKVQAGETVKVRKSAETAAAGTVTATTGSVSVATTNDLSAVCPANTVIRIGGDNTLYLVKAVSSSAITLWRPYRGTTGAGKGLAYYAPPTSADSDWNPLAMVGTAALPITVTGGVNTADDVQDGFTIMYGNNANRLIPNASIWTYVNTSRVATLYWAMAWGGKHTNPGFTNCFAFRGGQAFANPVYSSMWGANIDGFVCESCPFKGYADYAFVESNLLNIEAFCDINAIGAIHISMVNCIITTPKTTNYHALGFNYYFLQPYNVRSRIISPVLDELNTGSKHIYVYIETSMVDVVMTNPIFGGAGTVFTAMNTRSFNGALHMSNVNGSLTDHRVYAALMDDGGYALVSYDAVTYKTTGPAAKIELPLGTAYPFVIKHFIPVNTGVAQTISVWVRKNSSYGSLTRPTMRLRWMTGSAGALVSNVHDEVMSDTNDTWVQLSYEVTPVTNVVVMELLFQSLSTSAIARYDDIGVA